MDKRVYRPTIASFMPYLSLALIPLALAIGCWVIYFYKSSWLNMAAAVVFSLIALWSLLTSFIVFTTGVTMTAWGLEVSGFISRSKISWEDMDKVHLIEKFRGYLPPARTDRMILFYSRIGEMMMSFNTNTWPGKDEKEFLKVLHEQQGRYGFKILRGTSLVGRLRR